MSISLHKISFSSFIRQSVIFFGLNLNKGRMTGAKKASVNVFFFSHADFSILWLSVCKFEYETENTNTNNRHICKSYRSGKLCCKMSWQTSESKTCPVTTTENSWTFTKFPKNSAELVLLLNFSP